MLGVSEDRSGRISARRRILGRRPGAGVEGAPNWGRGGLAVEATDPLDGISPLAVG